jgi:hypothetical protein
MSEALDKLSPREREVLAGRGHVWWLTVGGQPSELILEVALEAQPSWLEARTAEGDGMWIRNLADDAG